MKENKIVSTYSINEKLTMREKLSYGLMVMGSNPLLGLASGFLMIFYTDIVGLNPIAVGTLFLVARFVDGISDPIMGYVLDRLPRHRMGKYRFVMIIGSFICCANFALIWFGPLWVTTGKLVVAYITYLLFGFTFDLMDVSKNSIYAAITPNTVERTKLGKVDALFTTLSALFVSIAAPIILAQGGSTQNAFAIVVLLVIGFALFASVVGTLGVKERVKALDTEEKHTFKDYLKIFTHRPIIAMMIFSILFTSGFFMANAVSTYFFTYVIGDLAALGAVSAMQLLGLIPGVLLAGVFIKKLGVKGSFIAAPLAMIPFVLIRLIDPISIPLIIVSTIGLGFLLGAYQPAGKLIIANNIDYIEHKIKYRSEPAVASINSFIAKLSQGLGGAIPGYVLGLSGYIPNAAEQPQSLITALILMVTVIPCIMYFLSAIVFKVLYNLDDKTIEAMQSVLNERRMMADIEGTKLISQ
jgi:GPH family glycoside/pentoside/hexuronide:cation symporter/glucuronide carrier protein